MENYININNKLEYRDAEIILNSLKLLYERCVYNERDFYMWDGIEISTDNTIMSWEIMSIYEKLDYYYKEIFRHKTITDEYGWTYLVNKNNAEKIIKYFSNNELHNTSTITKDHKKNLIDEIIETIKKFKPSYTYKTENLYQSELIGWLKAHFQSNKVAMEVISGSSRPDIVIDTIAIEIKGPTTGKSLDSVLSKCPRYKREFGGGVIIVLFDVKTNERRYSE